MRENYTILYFLFVSHHIHTHTAYCAYVVKEKKNYKNTSHNLIEWGKQGNSLHIEQGEFTKPLRKQGIQFLRRGFRMGKPIKK